MEIRGCFNRNLRNYTEVRNYVYEYLCIFEYKIYVTIISIYLYGCMGVEGVYPSNQDLTVGFSENKVEGKPTNDDVDITSWRAGSPKEILRYL